MLFKQECSYPLGLFNVCTLHRIGWQAALDSFLDNFKTDVWCVHKHPSLAITLRSSNAVFFALHSSRASFCFFEVAVSTGAERTLLGWILVKSPLWTVWWDGSMISNSNWRKRQCMLTVLRILLPNTAPLRLETSYTGIWLLQSVRLMNAVVVADNSSAKHNFVKKLWYINSPLSVQPDWPENGNRLILLVPIDYRFTLSSSAWTVGQSTWGSSSVIRLCPEVKRSQLKPDPYQKWKPPSILKSMRHLH